MQKALAGEKKEGKKKVISELHSVFACEKTLGCLSYQSFLTTEWQEGPVTGAALAISAVLQRV